MMAEQLAKFLKMSEGSFEGALKTIESNDMLN